MAYIRVTRPAGLIEIRAEYMRDSVRVNASLREALEMVAPLLLDSRVRIEGWGRDWGIKREFRIVSSDPKWFVEAIGRILDWVLRNRSLLWLWGDGYVARGTARIDTVRVVLEPRLYRGLRVTLLLASNWLLGEKRKRYGKDNAVYIEYDNVELLERIAKAVASGKPVRAVTPSVPLRLYMCSPRCWERISGKIVAAELSVEAPKGCEECLYVKVERSEPDILGRRFYIIEDAPAAVMGFGVPRPPFLYPRGTRFVAEKCDRGAIIGVVASLDDPLPC